SPGPVSGMVTRWTVGDICPCLSHRRWFDQTTCALVHYDRQSEYQRDGRDLDIAGNGAGGFTAVAGYFQFKMASGGCDYFSVLSGRMATSLQNQSPYPSGTAADKR